MAIAHVQDAGLGSTTNGTSQSTGAFASNPTVGNYIVVWLWTFTGANSISSYSVSDTGSNAYTGEGFIQVNAGGNNIQVGMAYTKVGTSGASFNVSVTGLPSASAIFISGAEFSGVAASSPVDGSAVTNSSTSTTATSLAAGSMTVTSGDLVCSVLQIENGATNTGIALPTQGGSWTETDSALVQNGSTGQAGEAGWIINPTSPVNPTWTWTSTSAQVGSATAAFALLAAAAGGGRGNFLPMLGVSRTEPADYAGLSRRGRRQRREWCSAATPFEDSGRATRAERARV